MMALLHLDSGDVGMDLVHPARDPGGDVSCLPFVVIQLASGAQFLGQLALLYGFGQNAGPFFDVFLFLGSLGHRH